MGLETKLSLKQTQKLVMTQALQQAIKLLPMARLELVQAIRQELTENPMLEEVALAEDGVTPAEEDDTPSPDESADTVADGKELYDINWQEYFPEDWEWKGLPSEEYEERFSYENTARTPTTLSEHLLAQLMMATTDEVERRIGAFLIGNIDDEGYLRCELDEAITATEADHATVAHVLSMIQTFDPTGIGARDLRECLLIQVRFLGLEGSLIETIISDYLPKLQERGAQHLTECDQRADQSLESFQRRSDHGAAHPEDPRSQSWAAIYQRTRRGYCAGCRRHESRE